MRPGEHLLHGTKVEVDIDPDPADEAKVFAGLRAFNERIAGPANEVRVSVFVRDGVHRVLGGLVGVVKYRWLHIDLLWLPEPMRGRGMGSALVHLAEKEAVARGCIGAHVETTDYQALPFYEKLGYEVFGTLEGYPPGSRAYCLGKRLADGDA